MVEEYCDLPFNFGECKEKAWTANAVCLAWESNGQRPFDVTLFKNGRQRAMYIPEVLFKSKTTKTNARLIISISMDTSEIAEYIGENDINFGTYGFSGDENMKKRIISVPGKIEKNYITIGDDNNYFSPVDKNGLIGIASTFITFEIRQDDPDSQEPPTKEPFTDEEEEENEEIKGNTTVDDDDYEMADGI